MFGGLIMRYEPLKNFYYNSKELFEETYNQRFNSPSTLKFDFDISGNQAFLVINNEILNLLELIYSADKELTLLTDSKAIPEIALQQFTNKCIVDEIHLTNKIEGVNSTRKEINDILNSPSGRSSNERFYGITQKYKLLVKEDIPLTSCQHIRNLYNDLVLSEVVSENPGHAPDGQIFRKDYAYVKSKKATVKHTGLYPEEKIIDAMSRALSILNNGEYSFLIRIAVFHYLFGYIHPFYDGNGRTSRFISSYLISKNLSYLVSYSLSYIIRKNISSYYKSFDLTNHKSNKGDLTPFVIQFLEIIYEAYMHLMESLKEKFSKLCYCYEESKKIAKNDKELGDLLFVFFQHALFAEEEGITIKELSSVLEYNENKIRGYIKNLYAENILKKHSANHKNYYEIDLSKFDI